MNEERRKALREATEAKDLLELDALRKLIDRQSWQVVEIAAHYVATRQHPAAPHIHTYLHLARKSLEDAWFTLGQARLWIPPGDEDGVEGGEE